MLKEQPSDRKAFFRLAQRMRVPVGFLLAPLMVLSARPTWPSLAGGALVGAAGLAIRGWASGHLRKNEELTTTGPYAYTRNPLYLGTFLLGTGAAISTGALWFVCLFGALYLLIYVPVMIAEAETMRALFPEEYEAYSRHVPVFAPRVTPFASQPGAGARPVALGPGNRSFDISLYLRHREYRAALGLAVVLMMLVAKLYLNL